MRGNRPNCSGEPSAPEPAMHSATGPVLRELFPWQGQSGPQGHTLRMPLDSLRGKATSLHLGWTLRAQLCEPRGEGMRGRERPGDRETRGVVVTATEGPKGSICRAPQLLIRGHKTTKGLLRGPQTPPHWPPPGGHWPHPKVQSWHPQWQETPPALQVPAPRAHLAISGSDDLIHLSVFFIMDEFCIKKKGRKSLRIRRG